MIVKVVIDKRKCIGSQTCVQEDDEHFQMDENNEKALVRKDRHSELLREVEMDVNEEQKKKLMLVAQYCPTQSIKVFDENNIQLFPK